MMRPPPPGSVDRRRALRQTLLLIAVAIAIVFLVVLATAMWVLTWDWSELDPVDDPGAMFTALAR